MREEKSQTERGRITRGELGRKGMWIIYMCVRVYINKM